MYDIRISVIYDIRVSVTWRDISLGAMKTAVSVLEELGDG